MMSYETKLAIHLPVIDFTSEDLILGTVEWDSVRGNVRKRSRRLRMVCGLVQ